MIPVKTHGTAKSAWDDMIDRTIEAKQCCS
jgi:hypothetical protein